jgi:hypothetical protein
MAHSRSGRTEFQFKKLIVEHDRMHREGAILLITSRLDETTIPARTGTVRAASGHKSAVGGPATAEIGNRLRGEAISASGIQRDTTKRSRFVSNFRKRNPGSSANRRPRGDHPPHVAGCRASAGSCLMAPSPFDAPPLFTAPLSFFLLPGARGFRRPFLSSPSKCAFLFVIARRGRLAQIGSLGARPTRYPPAHTDRVKEWVGS